MSEPERPSVVVSPRGLRAMKPVTTGTIPFAEHREERAAGRAGRSSSGRRSRRRASRRSRASAGRRRRAPGRPRAESAAATSGAERRSPKEAMRSVTRGDRSRRSETPGERASSSSSGARVEGDARSGRLREGAGGLLVPRAQPLDDLAGRCRAGPASASRAAARSWSVTPPIAEATATTGPRRAAARRRSAALRIRFRVPERGAAELVDGDPLRHDGPMVPAPRSR